MRRHIDWSTAEMDGGDLTVELAGEADKGWTKRFAALVELLDRGGAGWGEIAVKKDAVHVAGVHEGAAEDLHHLLEGVVQQLDADAAGDANGDPDPEQESESPREQADRRLTEQFRAFAGDSVTHG